MALTPAQLAAKKRAAELRRKKIRAQKAREDRLMSRGDFSPVMGRHKRRLKDNRNHHRKMSGTHTRKYKEAHADGEV